MVTRGCEERGLIEMAKRNQVDLERITIIGLACTAEERDHCRCAAVPYPSSQIDVGEKWRASPMNLVAEHEKLSLARAAEFWQEQFARCIKCYACRTVCPQCFCEVCVLEDDMWVETGRAGPALPLLPSDPRLPHRQQVRRLHGVRASLPGRHSLDGALYLLRRDAEEMFEYVPDAASRIRHRCWSRQCGKQSLEPVEYKNVPTTCIYCGCGCGIYLQVLDGKLVACFRPRSTPSARANCASRAGMPTTLSTIPSA